MVNNAVTLSGPQAWGRWARQLPLRVPQIWIPGPKGKSNLVSVLSLTWRKSVLLKFLSHWSRVTWSTSSPLHQDPFLGSGTAGTKEKQGQSENLPHKHIIDIYGPLCPGRRWGASRGSHYGFRSQPLQRGTKGLSTGNCGDRIIKHLASLEGSANRQAGRPSRLWTLANRHQPSMCGSPQASEGSCPLFAVFLKLHEPYCDLAEKKAKKEHLSFPGLGSNCYPKVLISSSVPNISFAA